MIYNLVLQCHQAWPALRAPQVSSLIDSVFGCGEPLPAPGQCACGNSAWNTFFQTSFLDSNTRAQLPGLWTPDQMSPPHSHRCLFTFPKLLPPPLCSHNRESSYLGIQNTVEITLYMPASCSKLLAPWGLGPVLLYPQHSFIILNNISWVHAMCQS